MTEKAVMAGPDPAIHAFLFQGQTNKMPLPAIALLDPACPIKPAWAIFDPIWYLKKYQPHLPANLIPTPQTLLGHYLQTGCRNGHSPNPFFDEPFYLSANPDIAILVEAGHFRSGFDHFCQHGHRTLSPHWLFDDAHYGSLHDDMTLENLDLNKFHGRYDHYLKSGQHEHRSPHPLFDSRFTHKNAATAAADPEHPGPFTHYLAQLNAGAPEPQPSIYFDPAWYIQQHPEIAETRHGPAIEHYLTHGKTDPIPEFSEQFYVETNPDIRHLIASGQYRNGYHHFLTLGAFELRAPSPDIDLIRYSNANPCVQNDLNAGLARDAFTHLLTTGKKLRLSTPSIRTGTEISEAATKQLFINKARANLTLFARQKLDFTPTAEPALTVVMVLFEKFELTMLSLCSLRANYPGAVELIIIDNASTDASPRIGEYIAGAKIILLAQNIGYPSACNLGLAEATAPAILFLNNDIELGHGAIAAALARLQSDPKIGATGGKIIRSNGKLQEAGSIIWKDGAVTGYMRDASPLAPEANFTRDVDLCSGVFLLCRTALIQQLGGFDPNFNPAYYEDVDLCLRIAAAGHRVVYDPQITLHHLEYGSAANTEASMALMRRGQKIFTRKHQNILQQQLDCLPRNTLFARARNNRRKRILFIEDTIPLRHLGSGYVRANDIVRAIAAANYDVAVFPLNATPRDIIRTLGDFPDHLEILYDRDIGGLAELLETRRCYYDAIWISRTHNLSRILPILRQAGIEAPLILDTEAIVTSREAARAALRIPPADFNFATKLQSEFATAACCRQLIAVNQMEAGHLNALGFPTVAVLGTQCVPQPTPNSFAAREGLLFVAAIHQPDSPNLDALNWYADAILPALALEMRQIPVLNVVGYTDREIDLSRFANHPHIKIHGPAADLQPYYNANRLFIAPTRFAAGTPYKLYETAAFGLPAITTNLLAGQLLWQDSVELLTAPVTEPKKFASRIAHLYRSEADWNKLRANALARISQENTPEQFKTTIANILASVLEI